MMRKFQRERMLSRLSSSFKITFDEYRPRTEQNNKGSCFASSRRYHLSRLSLTIHTGFDTSINAQWPRPPSIYTHRIITTTRCTFILYLFHLAQNICQLPTLHKNPLTHISPTTLANKSSNSKSKVQAPKKKKNKKH